jgi:hypothetical protein
MNLSRPSAARIRDVAFFAVFLGYAWAGIDTRLIYHWQGPVFSTVPGFAGEFLKYPGGPAEYLYGLIAQAYAWQGWGAIVLTAQALAVLALTRVFFAALAGRALPLASYFPAALLLYYANLYYDRMPLALALLFGLAPAILFIRLSRRWRGEAVLLGVYVALLALSYYLAGVAMVFFASTAALVRIARRPRHLLWIAYPLLAAALPAAVEIARLAYVPASASGWFVDTDGRRLVACWGLYAFYALGAAFVLFHRPSEPAAPFSKDSPSTRLASNKLRPARPLWRPLLPVLAAILPLLGLGCVAFVSHRLNAPDRRLAALDFYSYHEDWPAVVQASPALATADFNPLTRYQINLALHEMNRLGDDMFRFPQAGPILPELRIHWFLPYMIDITDLCLRLGRVNEAERFGAEAMILGHSDPRVCRAMAAVNLVKGQTAAARKFLTFLSYDAVAGPWARRRLLDLDRDSQLAGDPQIQLLRRRMLRHDDMLAVWQRAGQPGADMERLLLDQLRQDPSNRMAFEFLMGAYLVARDVSAVSALMPRIKDMTGPAYVLSDGRRRTPRHYQEAMALYADMTGKPVNIEGFEIQPETLQRMAAFRRIVIQFPSRERAMQAVWNEYRDTYFFYYVFGPGDYR